MVMEVIVSTLDLQEFVCPRKSHMDNTERGFASRGEDGRGAYMTSIPDIAGKPEDMYDIACRSYTTY